MELIETPKTNYLLDAGLEILHYESNEWLSDVEFWRDEAAFFYSYFLTSTLKKVPVDSKEVIEDIEKKLLELTTTSINKLEKEVMEHERYLANIIEKKTAMDEEAYREKHKEISKQIRLFKREFKALKREIFEFVKRIK